MLYSKLQKTCCMFRFLLLLSRFLGVKEIDQEQNLMQKATALLQESTEEASSSRQSEATQKLHPPATTVSYLVAGFIHIENCTWFFKVM